MPFVRQLECLPAFPSPAFTDIFSEKRSAGAVCDYLEAQQLMDLEQVATGIHWAAGAMVAERRPGRSPRPPEAVSATESRCSPSVAERAWSEPTAAFRIATCMEPEEWPGFAAVKKAWHFARCGRAAEVRSGQMPRPPEIARAKVAKEFTSSLPARAVEEVVGRLGPALAAGGDEGLSTALELLSALEDFLANYCDEEVVHRAVAPLYRVVLNHDEASKARRNDESGRNPGEGSGGPDFEGMD